jgi:DNA-binding response OmpR family regulator
MEKTHMVLIVEDRPSLAQMIRFLFLSQGMQVEGAFNGEEALQKVSQRLPDLILLDLMMPGMDGFETLRRLKADAATARIPVIILTARKEEEDRRRALSLGAVEYITKPFRAVEVVDKVRRHLNA